MPRLSVDVGDVAVRVLEEPGAFDVVARVAQPVELEESGFLQYGWAWHDVWHFDVIDAALAGALAHHHECLAHGQPFEHVWRNPIILDQLEGLIDRRPRSGLGFRGGSQRVGSRALISAARNTALDLLLHASKFRGPVSRVLIGDLHVDLGPAVTRNGGEEALRDFLQVRRGLDCWH